MLWYICNKISFHVIIYGAMLILFGIFIFNNLSGKKGTYNDYRDVMWQLWTQPPTSGKALRLGKKQSRGELECRRVLETQFNKPFPTSRPAFLHNSVIKGGKNLEIDCYNDEMKLGIEYNGRQHYEHTNFFHKNVQDFQTTQYRDDLKKRLCAENGIKLIVVPYTVPLENIKAYIINKLGDRKLFSAKKM